MGHRADTVFAATGAVPKAPSNIEGLRDKDGKLLYPLADSVRGKEKELGHHVVIIGGSESAMETAIYLLRAGHEVTMLTGQGRVAHDCSGLGVFFGFGVMAYWINLCLGDIGKVGIMMTVMNIPTMIGTILLMPISRKMDVKTIAILAAFGQAAASAIHAINFLFWGVPTLSLIASGVLWLFFNLREEKARQYREEVDARRAALQAKEEG